MANPDRGAGIVRFRRQRVVQVVSPSANQPRAPEHPSKRKRIAAVPFPLTPSSSCRKMRPPRENPIWRATTHGSWRKPVSLPSGGGSGCHSPHHGSFNRLGPWGRPAWVDHDRSGVSLGCSLRNRPSLNLDRRAPAFPTAPAVSSPSNRPYGVLGRHRAAECPSDRPATPPRPSFGGSPGRRVAV